MGYMRRTPGISQDLFYVDHAPRRISRRPPDRARAISGNPAQPAIISGNVSQNFKFNVTQNIYTYTPYPVLWHNARVYEFQTRPGMREGG